MGLASSFGKDLRTFINNTQVADLLLGEPQTRGNWKVNKWEETSLLEKESCNAEFWSSFSKGGRVQRGRRQRRAHFYQRQKSWYWERKNILDVSNCHWVVFLSCPFVKFLPNFKLCCRTHYSIQVFPSDSEEQSWALLHHFSVLWVLLVSLVLQRVVIIYSHVYRYCVIQLGLMQYTMVRLGTEHEFWIRWVGVEIRSWCFTNS